MSVLDKLSPEELAELDSQLEVSDILQKKYGFKEKDIFDDYENIASTMGLSGNQASDLPLLQEGQEEIKERATRLRKVSEMSPIGRRARAAVGTGLRTASSMAKGLMTMGAQGMFDVSLAPGVKIGGDPQKALEKARKLDEFQAKTLEITGEDPEYLQTFEGKVMGGAASLAAMMALPASIVPFMHSEAISFSEEVAGKPISEMNEAEQEKALESAGMSTIVNGALEKIGLGRITKKLFKSGGTKKAILNILESAFVEGSTESAQNKVLRGIVKAVEDSDVEIFEADDLAGMISEFFVNDDFAVGAILGGGVRGGFEVAPRVYQKFLNPENAATKVDFKAVQDQTDDQIRDAVLAETGDSELAELAVKAKAGDEAARKEYVDRAFYKEGDLEVTAGITPEEADVGFPVLPEPKTQKEVQELDVKIRAAALDAASELVTLSEDVEIDRDDTRVVGAIEELNKEADSLGYNEDQRAEFITEQLTAAAANNGLTYEEMLKNAERLKVAGSADMEFLEEAIKYKVMLNEGAELDTFYEEITHTEFKRFRNSDPKALEKVRKWKKQIEEETGEVTHGDSETDVDEWIARKGVAWAMKNHDDARKMGTLDTSIRAWIERFMAKLRAVFRDAKLLRRMEARGQLNPEFKEFLDRAVIGRPVGGDKASDTSFSIKLDQEPASQQIKLDQTQTPEFKKWFGDSKVVDKDGKPLVVYHGTWSPESFDEFKPASFFSDSIELAESYTKVRTSQVEEGQKKPKTSERVYPVYLKMENPLDLRKYGDSLGLKPDPSIPISEKNPDSKTRILSVLGMGESEFKDKTGIRPDQWLRSLRFFESRNDDPSILIAGDVYGNEKMPKEVMLFLQKLGFDGVILSDTPVGDAFSDRERASAYVAFNPSQIKSATGNVGTFDPADPRISRQIKGFEEGQVEPTERDLTPEEIKAIETRLKLTKAKKEASEAKGKDKKAAEKKVIKLREKLAKEEANVSNAIKVRKLQESYAQKIALEAQRRTEAIKKKFEQQKNLEQSMKELESLVQSLPLEVRGKFRGFGTLAEKVSETAQQRFLERSIRRVESIFDQYLLKQNKKKLSKILLRFGSKTGSRSKKKRQDLSSRYTKEVRDAFEIAYKVSRFEEVSKPEDMDEETYSGLLATFNGTLMRADAASASKVKDALIEAELMLNEGRTKMKKFREEKKAEKEALIEEAKEAVTGQGKPAKKTQELKGEQLQRSTLKKARSALAGVFFHALNGWQQHMNILDGKRGGFLEEEFSTLNAEIEKGRLDRQHWRDTEKAVDQIFGDDKKAALWMKSAVRSDYTVEIQGEKLMKVQALDLLNQWGDKSLSSTWEKMELTEAEIAKVKEFLGAEGVALSNYMREAYKEGGQAMQEVSERVDGVPIDLVEGYGGAIERERDDGSIDSTESIFDYGEGSRPTVKNGSFKARAGVTNPIIFGDAIQKFQNHFRELNHYLAFAEWAKKADATFSDKQFQNAIISEHGNGLLEAIQETKGRIIGGGNKAKGWWQKLSNKIRANITTATLAAKPSITIKQLTSIPAFTEDIGFRNYSKASLELFKDPLVVIKEIYNSDYIKNRRSTTQYADIRQEIEKASGLTRKLTPSEWLMFNVKIGDIGAVIVGGAPVYVHYKNEAKAKAMTGQAAKDYAMMKFAQASDRAQQASSEASKGLYLGSQGISRSFFMYQTSPIQYQRNINVTTYNLGKSISKWSEGRSDAEVKPVLQQFYRAVIVYHFLLPQIFQATASGFTGIFDDDDEQFWKRQKRALLWGNLSVFPVIGDMLGIISDKITDTDEVYFSSGSPLVDFGREFQENVYAFKSMDDWDSWYKIVEQGATVTGVPLETARKILENADAVIEGDTDYPIMRSLQWSAWALGED